MESDSIFHGLVVPLYGTGWDRLDWNRLHHVYRVSSRTGTGLQLGVEPVPGTGTDLQRGYITCPWDRGQVSFDLSLGQVWYRQRACTMCLYQTCPTGTGTLPLPNLSRPFFSSLPKSALDQVYGVSLSKNQRGPNQISEIPHQKSVSNSRCTVLKVSLTYIPKSGTKSQTTNQPT